MGGRYSRSVPSPVVNDSNRNEKLVINRVELEFRLCLERQRGWRNSFLNNLAVTIHCEVLGFVLRISVVGSVKYF